MQVEAIYNQGRIEFVQPLRLKHDHVRLVVTVPDEEVLLAPDIATVLPPQSEGALEIRSKIDAILGPYKDQIRKGSPLSAQDCKDIWHQHLEEKYLGR